MLDVGGRAGVVGVDSLLLGADSDSRCSSGGSASVGPDASPWLTWVGSPRWVGSASGGAAISTAWTVNDVFEKLETMISARHLPFLPGSTPSETSHPLGRATAVAGAIAALAFGPAFLSATRTLPSGLAIA